MTVKKLIEILKEVALDADVIAKVDSIDFYVNATSIKTYSKVNL